MNLVYACIYEGRGLLASGGIVYEDTYIDVPKLLLVEFFKVLWLGVLHQVKYKHASLDRPSDLFCCVLNLQGQVVKFV